MTKPLLPKLKNTAKIALPKSGVWTSNAQTNVDNLVQDLLVTGSQASDISSIPDIWARPAMYENVLFDEEHQLHNKFLHQWRGLLAILALREANGYDNIDVLALELGNVKEGQRFLQIAASMLPRWYRDACEDKATGACLVNILKWDKSPLALVWPTILVCPAQDFIDYDNKCAWWARGIGDPIPYLTDDEKMLLVDWITFVKQEILKNVPASIKSKIDALIGLLDDFQKDLGGKGYPASNLIDGHSLKIIGFCQCIGRAQKIKLDAESFLARSNVLLRKRTGRSSENVLLVTDDICEQWNKKPNEIYIGKALSFGKVYSKYSGLRDDGSLANYKASLRLGKDLFTEKLCLIYTDKDIFSAAFKNYLVDYKGSLVNVLVPLKPELLNYLTPDYITEHLTILSQDGKITVSMDVPLSGFDSDGKMLNIKREYTRDNIIELGDEVPVLQLWPNLITANEEKWQCYYSFYDERNESFYAKPNWDEGTYKAVNYLKNNRDNYKVEILAGKSFPEAYICYKKSSGYINEEVVVGLILLKKPTPIVELGLKKAKIGIDFGTTNTVAYEKIEGKNPNLIRFDNRIQDDASGMLLNITQTEELEQGRIFFMPPCCEMANDLNSISTIWHIQQINHNGARNDISKNDCFATGNVYYLGKNFDIGANQNVDISSLKSDLKWSDVNGTGYIQSFIKQIALQALAEVVKQGANSVEWDYSYPKAFSEVQKDKLRVIWHNVLNASDGSGLNKVCSYSKGEAQEETESTAMARYFVKQGATPAAGGMICIDIGGGSTDIAIWYGDQIIAQTSLRFAGKHILTELLWHNKAMLFALKEDVQKYNDILDNMVMAIESSERDKFEFMLESFLKCHGDKVFANLNAKSNEKSIKKLVSNILLALSGIFYYSGVVLGCLKTEGRYREYEELPTIYIAGNGSKLLNWISNGAFSSKSAAGTLLKESFNNGVNIGQELQSGKAKAIGLASRVAKKVIAVDIKQTAQPKEEVAYGLVCDQQHFSQEAQASECFSKFFAGEEYCVGSKRGCALDNLTGEELLQKIRVAPDLPFLKEFIKSFNDRSTKLGFDKINFSNDVYAEIKRQVDQCLDDNQKKIDGSRKNAQEIEVEPFFVMLLKECLKVI